MADQKDQTEITASQTHITVNGDANFDSSFNANKSNLEPKEEEKLLTYFLKNPAKIRDWAITIFILYSIFKGASLADLLKILKE